MFLALKSLIEVKGMNVDSCRIFTLPCNLSISGMLTETRRKEGSRVTLVLEFSCNVAIMT